MLIMALGMMVVGIPTVQIPDPDGLFTIPDPDIPLGNPSLPDKRSGHIGLCWD